MGGLGKLPLPAPAPPSPPHISVSDLHDHEPDVPVLCFIQLMHQLPIVTLWETGVRADFKCVLPFIHPNLGLTYHVGLLGCFGHGITPFREIPVGNRRVWSGRRRGTRPLSKPKAECVMGATGQTLTWRFECGILPAWCEGRSSAQTPSPGDRIQGGKWKTAWTREVRRAEE